MSTTTTTPLHAELAPSEVVPALYRLTVEQYEAIADAEILTKHDRVELIDGLLVTKMTKKPAHSVAARAVAEALSRLVPDGFFLTREDPIRIGDASEPEPDAAVVRGHSRDYAKRHPEAKQVALIVEVADSSLSFDRTVKMRIYAAGEISVYWIVNLADGCLEVYSRPEAGAYRSRQVLQPTEEATVILDGRELGSISVSDLLP